MLENLKETISSQAGELRLSTPYPNKYFRTKKCKWCKTNFQPTAPSNHYCTDECAANARQDLYLKRNYNIDLTQYNEMLVTQDNKCKICGSKGFLMKDHHKMLLVVDHSHKSGVVRGLLCHNCNRALGLLQDNIDTLLSGVKYLKEGSETIPNGSTLE